MGRGSELRGRGVEGGGGRAERRMCWEEGPTGTADWQGAGFGDAGGGGSGKSPGYIWATSWVPGWVVEPLVGNGGAVRLGPWQVFHSGQAGFELPVGDQDGGPGWKHGPGVAAGAARALP